MDMELFDKELLDECMQEIDEISIDERRRMEDRERGWKNIIFYE
jgi:hypothetical protein